jgi:hypothetical protein
MECSGLLVLFNELMTGTGSLLYRVSLNVLTMREGEPLSGKMDLQDEVHPAALLCFGIYWQFFRPL